MTTQTKPELTESQKTISDALGQLTEALANAHNQNILTLKTLDRAMNEASEMALHEMVLRKTQ
ncbi:hypothetical protein [Synechococcus sp. WH 8016]|uniref:hypothetical protein n=1 Tax=Synechococcus sp. WH 8016 TaxID=166318 RepID=UPI00022D7D78|nr:hypothetical protein [Synechococcus sp. WH 8016]EHA63772.1 hypothetical protein Syn8016DRAFT_0813 [Synechococcus sp. WH 8016]